MKITEYKFNGFERVVKGENNGFIGYIAIHSTILGPALGGCRIFPYENEQAALVDVLNLAKGMTYKSAAAGLDLGGGKCVIIYNPIKKTPELLTFIAEFINYLKGDYITAEDSGSSLYDMKEIAKKCNYVASIKGSGDPSPFTALGVYTSMITALKQINQKLKGKKVLVVGVGNVGWALCELLQKAKAKLIIYDNKELTLRIAKKAFNSIRDKRECKILISEQQIIDCNADIYAPCAMGNAITEELAKKSKFSIICGGANNQLEEEFVGKILFDRNIIYIPDFIANAGGIINVFSELDGKYTSEKATKKVLALEKIVTNILKKSKKLQLPTNIVAEKIAEERLCVNL